MVHRLVGRPWTELSTGQQSVATALTRSLGLGFFAAGLALLVACVTDLAHQDVATYSLAAIALVFCSGLAVINRRLQLATSTGTPWKQSLYAVAAIIVAVALYGIG